MRPLERLAVRGLNAWALARYDWRDAVKFIENGVHSQIPICCVSFFVVRWMPWQKLYSQGLYGQAIPHPYEDDLRLAGLGEPRTTAPHYLPCPDCLRSRRFVEIHNCTEACGRGPVLKRDEVPETEGDA